MKKFSQIVTVATRFIHAASECPPRYVDHRRGSTNFYDFWKRWVTIVIISNVVNNNNDNYWKNVLRLEIIFVLEFAFGEVPPT